jgi:hypothetical protein
VILHLDGQPPVAGVEARTLGHGPALQDASLLEAKVVVELPRVVFVKDVPERRRVTAGA